MANALYSISLDYVEFYTVDSDASVDEMVNKYGFEVVGKSRNDLESHRTVALRIGDFLLVLTQGMNGEHPASGYVAAHGDGVANIVFRTSDVREVFAAVVAGGARALAAPAEAEGTVTAVIEGFGDVRHSFIQRSVDEAPGALPPGLLPVKVADGRPSTGLREMDHIAVLVEGGQLEKIVEFYESALGFRMIFEERFTIGSQGMNSQVVRNAAGDVTLTIVEPELSGQPGRLDDFVKDHGGPGIQHLAFLTDDIVQDVATLQSNGVDFLTTPGTYYDLLPERIDLVRHTVAELRELGILADLDHAGQLFQIFTRSTHPRKTFFLEIIERVGAETFGRGNVKALYEAIELERAGAEGGR